MAAVFKYIKKAIVTITKGPRKGQKELRYFYKGDKIPGAAKAAAKTAAKPAFKSAVGGIMEWKQVNQALMNMGYGPKKIVRILMALSKAPGGTKKIVWKNLNPILTRQGVPLRQHFKFMQQMRKIRGL